MATNTGATRRMFLKGGALLAAPLAAVSVSAAALAGDGMKDRVTRLEDEAAIRELHQSWLRRLNAGGCAGALDRSVRRIAAHPAGVPDRIEFGADSRRAVGYFDCTVEFETPLAPDSTLAQMAHVQGFGAVLRSERRLMRVHYLKAGDGWKMGTASLTRP